MEVVKTIEATNGGVLFSKLTKREKNLMNIDFLKEQRDLFEYEKESRGDNYVKYDDLIYTLEEEKAISEDLNELRDIIKNADDEKYYKKRCEFWNEFLDVNEYYYILGRGAEEFIKYDKKTGMWEEVDAALSKTSFMDLYQIRNKIDRRAFDDILSSKDRKKKAVRFSFKDLPSTILNKFRRDEWLPPKGGSAKTEEDVHIAIRALISAVGNRDRDAMDYIEKIVAWKYRRPHRWDIPTTCIFGAGGVGKNTFSVHLLGTVFGQKAVRLANAKTISSDFNESLEEAVVMTYDEINKNPALMNTLKAQRGQARVVMNAKHKREREIDNNPMCFIFGNAETGPLLLDGDGKHGADRRWAIIRVEHDIYSILREDYGMSDMDDRELGAWWNNAVKTVIENPKEVRVWLSYILDKHSDDDEDFPAPYQGDDYDTIVNSQKSPHVTVFENIVNRDLDYFWLKDVFAYYEVYCQKYFKAIGKNTKNGNDFLALFERWLEDNHPEYILTDNLYYVNEIGKRSKNKGWKKPSIRGTQDMNRSVFLKYQGNGRETLNEDLEGSDDIKTRKLKVKFEKLTS